MVKIIYFSYALFLSVFHRSLDGGTCRDSSDRSMERDYRPDWGYSQYHKME